MNHERYLRRQKKKKAQQEKPLADLLYAIETCVVPTILLMKGYLNVGNFQAVELGIENLIDTFSEFIYKDATGNENQSSKPGDSHGNAVESATAAELPATDAGESAADSALERGRNYPLPLRTVSAETPDVS